MVLLPLLNCSFSDYKKFELELTRVASLFLYIAILDSEFIVFTDPSSEKFVLLVIQVSGSSILRISSAWH